MRINENELAGAVGIIIGCLAIVAIQSAINAESSSVRSVPIPQEIPAMSADDSHETYMERIKSQYDLSDPECINGSEANGGDCYPKGYWSLPGAKSTRGLAARETEGETDG